MFILPHFLLRHRRKNLRSNQITAWFGFCLFCRLQVKPPHYTRVKWLPLKQNYRKLKIPNKRFLYYTNLSTHKFYKPNFILPVYDMIARISSYYMAMVRDNLPSGKINNDGSIILRAEAYSRIPLEDLRQ